MLGLLRVLALGLMVCECFPREASAAESLPAHLPIQDVVQSEPADTPSRPFGDDVLEAFVPREPRTSEDRKRIESLRDYAAARALEDNRRWSEAIETYRKALENQPDSVAILRRVSRLCFILGRTRQAVEYAERVLDADPNDTDTLSRLVEYHDRRNDPAAAEALLLKVLGNPQVQEGSPGYLVINRDLGELYATKLDDVQKAADAFERVLKALDQKAANNLSLIDQRRLLGFDEATAYAAFGEIFQKAGRDELAVVAFRRGLIYDPNHPLLPRLLAQSLLDAGRPDEALGVLESFLKRQPQGREPYELLAEILTTLDRQDEILPRIEAASEADTQNLALKYLLADRYREAGQPEKADAIYRAILASQPDPQGFGALAASLVRERKYVELIELLGKAFSQPDTLEAVKPQIEVIANDPKFTEVLLATAKELQDAEPPKLSKESRLVLAYIATKAEKLEMFVDIQREALRQDPDPQAYRELFVDLYRAGMHAQAAATLEEMLAAFPNERSPQILVALGQSRALSGDLERALEAAREASRLDPNDQEALRFIGFVLNRLGRNEELIKHYEEMLERFPNDDEVLKVARSGLSIAHVNMGNLAEGQRQLELLLERYPEDAGVNNDLGYLYADQGKNLEQAESMIRKAIAEDPENPAYLDSLGWVLYKQGKIEESLAPLEQAAKLVESERAAPDPTILDHLGDVYFKLQRIDAAREAWISAEKAASESTPTDTRLAEIRKKLESLKELDPALLDASGDEAPQP